MEFKGNMYQFQRHAKRVNMLSIVSFLLLLTAFCVNLVNIVTFVLRSPEGPKLGTLTNEKILPTIVILIIMFLVGAYLSNSIIKHANNNLIPRQTPFILIIFLSLIYIVSIVFRYSNMPIASLRFIMIALLVSIALLCVVAIREIKVLIKLNNK